MMLVVSVVSVPSRPTTDIVASSRRSKLSRMRTVTRLYELTALLDSVTSASRIAGDRSLRSTVPLIRWTATANRSGPVDSASGHCCEAASHVTTSTLPESDAAAPDADAASLLRRRKRNDTSSRASAPRPSCTTSRPSAPSHDPPCAIGAAAPTATSTGKAASLALRVPTSPATVREESGSKPAVQRSVTCNTLLCDATGFSSRIAAS
jgi:hypothetical protein